MGGASIAPTEESSNESIQHEGDVGGFLWLARFNPLRIRSTWSDSLLIPYEQYYIQTLYREGKLIPEQRPGEINPIFQTAINPQPPHSTWTDQLFFCLQHGYHSNPTTPKLPTHIDPRYVQSQIHSNIVY